MTGDGRGHLIAFGVGVDGALWTSSQLTTLSATTSWRAWISLGHPAKAVSGLVRLPAAGLDPGGRLHVVVRAADGGLWEAGQNRAGGRSYTWVRSPFANQVAGDPVMARDSSGALQVFAPRADGAILVISQAPGGGPWNGSRSLGRPAGAALGISAVAVLRDGAGRLEAFATTADGSIFSSTQTRAARWTPWNQIGSASSAMAAVLRPDRLVQVFSLNRGELMTTIRHGNAWSPWITLGHGLSGGIATSLGADGSQMVLTGTSQDTLLVRSADPQGFDGRSGGRLAIEFAQLQAQAWNILPGLPHVGNLGHRRGPF